MRRITKFGLLGRSNGFQGCAFGPEHKKEDKEGIISWEENICSKSNIWRPV